MKLALRQLIKSPGFTVVALLTLALGIGVSTTAFTALNRLLLQSLPFREPERLVQIWMTSPQSQQMGMSPGEYFDLCEHSQSFETLSAYYVSYASSFTEPGKPAERFTGLACTANFLSLIGVQPMLGRAFTAEEQKRGDGLALLSYRFWQKRFGGDPNVLGRVIRVSAKPTTIIGVMPPFLDDPMLFGTPVDMWGVDNTDVNRNLRLLDGGWYLMAARLKAGVTLGQAQAELKALAERYAHDFPNTNTNRGLRVIPYPTDQMGEIGGRITWLIMALSLAVLAIACVNLANLQLIRTTGRAREIAIRLALGSPRHALIRMLLTESFILAMAGGALGLLVAKWGNAYLAQYFELDMPLNLRVIAFAFVASVLTGALFGVFPAWTASRSDVNRALKQGSRGSTSDRSRHRLRHSLIVVELALALTLLSGAGYFVVGLYRITHREFGWRADTAVSGFFGLSHDGYGEQRDPRSVVFAEKFCADLLAVPGVQHAVVSSGMPLFGPGGNSKFVVEGQTLAPGQELFASFTNVMPDYFATYGMRSLQGRDFTERDRQGSPLVAVVTESFARRFWPNENPIGKRIGSADPSQPQEWWEIVGVVNDIRFPFEQPSAEKPLQIYRPWAQNSHRFFTVTVSGSADGRALIDAVRNTLARAEPDVALTFIGPVRESLQQALAGFGFVRRLLIEIAVLGLLLAAVGIYGVVANLATERTQEVGIRMALGAQAANVRWLFLRTGLWLSGIGVGIGLAAAIGLTVALSKLIAMVPGSNPWLIVGIAILLVLVALLACWLPARRATKVNPMIALRAD